VHRGLDQVKFPVFKEKKQDRVAGITSWGKEIGSGKHTVQP
jgi:hypothetical protein